MTTRREFLKIAGIATTTMVLPAQASVGPHVDSDRFGVLADLTLCIGCRKCEWACAETNGLSNHPIEHYDDTCVFEKYRRPTTTQYTVVNRFPATATSVQTDAKVQCMHCEHPACVSACIVGALQKDPMGPVTYDADKCIGCRYCMVACPFQIPAYEYKNATTPQVRKCTLCSDKTLDGSGKPACVEICPREALTFGKRSELLKIAEQRIRRNPDRYIDHIYGEKEVGGTSWMMISGTDFKELKFPEVDDESPATVTEAIQHGIFRGFSGPLMLLGLLGATMKAMKKEPSDDI